jgi:hypothetical protein
LQQRLDEIGNNYNTVHLGREAVEKSLTQRDHEAAQLREMLEEQQSTVADAMARLKKADANAAAANADMLKEREVNKEILRAKVSCTIARLAKQYINDNGVIFVLYV